MRAKSVRLAAFLLLVFVSGCVSGKTGTSPYDPVPEVAMQVMPDPPEGRGAVCILRPENPTYQAGNVKISVGKRVLSKMRPGSYYYFFPLPGVYLVRADYLKNRNALGFNIVEGESLYLELNVVDDDNVIFQKAGRVNGLTVLSGLECMNKKK